MKLLLPYLCSTHWRAPCEPQTGGGPCLVRFPCGSQTGCGLRASSRVGCCSVGGPPCFSLPSQPQCASFLSIASLLVAEIAIWRRLLLRRVAAPPWRLCGRCRRFLAVSCAPPTKPVSSRPRFFNLASSLGTIWCERLPRTFPCSRQVAGRMCCVLSYAMLRPPVQPLRASPYVLAARRRLCGWTRHVLVHAAAVQFQWGIPATPGWLPGASRVAGNWSRTSVPICDHCRH